MLSEGSAILHTALQGRAYFKQVTIVVPLEWTETLCGQPIKSPTGNTPFRVRTFCISVRPALPPLNGCPAPTPPAISSVSGKQTESPGSLPPPLFHPRWGRGHLGPCINFLYWPPISPDELRTVGD